MSLIVIYSGVRMGESKVWELNGNKESLTRIMIRIHARCQRMYLTLRDDSGKIIDHLS